MEKKNIAHLQNEDLYKLGDAEKVQMSQLSNLSSDVDTLKDKTKKIKDVQKNILNEDIEKLLVEADISPNEARNLLDILNFDDDTKLNLNKQKLISKKSLASYDWATYYQEMERFAKENNIDINVDPFTTLLSQQEYEQLKDEIDGEFARRTKLSKGDIAFLFLAIGLQCCRQYLLTDFKERVDDQTAAKMTKGHNEEHSNRAGQWYNPSLEEIITNPVPFDTTFGAPEIESDIAKHGGHRYTVLGHDPILGWIFGTANIATSTLTDYKLESYHIKTGLNAKGVKLDKLTNHADTSKVMSKTLDKLLHEGFEGKKKVAVSLAKEYVHLKSDISTPHSLPIPAISLHDPELAKKLADYGFDAANIKTVGKQASYSMLINFIIAMIHRLLYNEEKDGDIKLYEVRTRKILLYSNLIATVSNVLYVALSVFVFENKAAVRKLDVGGLAVTLYRLISDGRFITSVKREFVEKKIYETVEQEIKLLEKNNEKLLKMEYDRFM